MANPFDQFDAPVATAANPFDQFDAPAGTMISREEADRFYGEMAGTIPRMGAGEDAYERLKRGASTGFGQALQGAARVADSFDRRIQRLVTPREEVADLPVVGPDGQLVSQSRPETDEEYNLRVRRLQMNNRSPINQALENSGQFTESAGLTETDVDQARNRTALGQTVDFLSPLAPVLASGPLAPVVGGAQMGEQGARDAMARGETMENVDRSAVLNATGGTALNLVPIPGINRAGAYLDDVTSAIRNRVTQQLIRRGGRAGVGAVTGAAVNTVGDIGLQLADVGSIDADRTLQNALVGAGSGLAVGATAPTAAPGVRRRPPASELQLAPAPEVPRGPSPEELRLAEDAEVQGAVQQNLELQDQREIARQQEEQLRAAYERNSPQGADALRQRLALEEAAASREALRQQEMERITRQALLLENPDVRQAQQSAYDVQAPAGGEALRNDLRSEETRSAELEAYAKQREEAEAQRVIERERMIAQVEPFLSVDIPDRLQLSPQAARAVEQFDDLKPQGSRSRQQRRLRLQDRSGFVSGEAALAAAQNPAIRAAGGAVGGAAYGITQGDTPEERARNALLYGAGGAASLALAPAALRLAGSGAAPRRQPFPENAQVMVQEYIGRDGQPKKAIQIDLIDPVTRDSNRSLSPEQLASEGFDLPDLSRLPQGIHSSADAVALSRTRDPEVRSVKGVRGLPDAVYVGRQQLPANAAAQGITGESFKLNTGIPGHPAGSNVSRPTLEAAGYVVPETPNFLAGESPPIPLQQLAANTQTPQSNATQTGQFQGSNPGQYPQAGGGGPPVQAGGGNSLPPGGQGAPSPQGQPPGQPPVPLTLYPGRVESYYRDAKRKLVDFAAPIEDTDAKFAKEYGYQSSEDLTNRIDRTLSAGKIAGQFMEDVGYFDILKDVDSLDDFGNYLIDKHALDVEAQGHNSGRDLAKAQQNVGANAQRYAFDEARLRQVSQSLLAKTVDYGLISPELAQKLSDTYPNYVPFDRVFDELERNPQNYSRRAIASLSNQSAIKAFEGSNRAIENPLGSFLKKAEDIFVQGEKNLAAQTLADRRTLPGWDSIIQEVPPNSAAPQNSFSYLQDGVKRTFAAPKEIADAAKALNVQTLGPIANALAIPLRIAKLGFTGLNIPFGLANISRDQLTTAIQSPNARAAVAAMPRAFMEAIKHGDFYDEAVRQGAMFTSYDVTRNNPMQTAEQIRSGRNLKSKIAYTVTHPREWLRTAENIIGRSEELARVQNFIGTLEDQIASGVPRDQAMVQAARAARETTANFGRRGEWGTVLNAGWLYLNAGIQASRATIRAARRSPVKFAAKVGMGLMAPVAMATAWNLSDEERKRAYEDIPDFEKENNLIILSPNPVQDASGRYSAIKIPLPPGLGRLAGLMRRPMEQMAGLDPVRFGQVSNSLLGAVSPVDLSSRSFTSNATPQAFKPALEALVNRNFFTSQDIVPPNLRRLDPTLQKDRNTSATAVWAGQQMGVSPMKIDHLIKGYLGGVGSQATNLLDRAAAAATPDDNDRVGGRSIAEDVRRRLFSSAGGETLNRFYQAYQEAAVARDSYRALVNQGDMERAEMWYSQNEKKISMAPYLEAVRDQLSTINTIRDSAGSEDEGTQKDLRSQKTQLARDAVREYMEAAK